MIEKMKNINIILAQISMMSSLSLEQNKIYIQQLDQKNEHH